MTDQPQSEDSEKLKVLLAQAAQGKEQGLEGIIQLAESKVRGWLFAKGVRGPDIESTLDDVWCRVWRGARRYRPDPRSTPWAWLKTIALRAGTDWLRSLRRQRTEQTVPVEETPDHDIVDDRGLTQAQLTELKTRVEKLLSQIPANDERILRLRFWDRLSHQEIRELMGLDSEETSRMRLCRALKALRDRAK
jgi:RNA polymerase sigma factor (sigma-70 family)